MLISDKYECHFNHNCHTNYHELLQLLWLLFRPTKCMRGDWRLVLEHFCFPIRTTSQHLFISFSRYNTTYSGRTRVFSFLSDVHSTYAKVLMPDLNSLPPSGSPSSRPQLVPSTNSSDTFRPTPQTPSPLSQSPSIAFATSADTLNPGSPRRRGSPRMERRRSSMLGNWNLNDSAGISAGAMADPNHQRTPSLGELHQELENEQEAQVVCTRS